MRLKTILHSLERHKPFVYGTEVPGSDFRNMFWGKGLGVVWTEM